MAEMVLSAPLGLLFKELWKAVKETKHRVKDFRPQLTKLEGTLEMLDPKIQDIQRMDTQLNNESEQREVEHLTSIMKDGKELVSKCHIVSGRRRPWNFVKKSYYQKKLVELDNELIRFIIKYMQPSTLLEVRRARLEQSLAFNRISDQIESLRSSTRSTAIATTSSDTSITSSAVEDDTTGHSEQIYPLDGGDLNLNDTSPLVPLPGPNRAPRIDTVGLILGIILPGVSITLRITFILIFIYKAMEKIMSTLEKSENEIWMMIKDVDKLQKIVEQLDDTIKSLVHMPEEIESNGELQARMKMNETEQSEVAESLRRLLEEGKKLVLKSSNIGRWNFLMNWLYQKKMVELDNKLLRYRYDQQVCLAKKNIDKTSDDSEMNNDELSERAAHYDKDRHEMKGRHMDTRKHESYSMLNDNPHQFMEYNRPPVSGSIGGFQQCALGR